MSNFFCFKGIDWNQILKWWMKNMKKKAGIAGTTSPLQRLPEEWLEFAWHAQSEVIVPTIQELHFAQPCCFASASNAGIREADVHDEKHTLAGGNYTLLKNINPWQEQITFTSRADKKWYKIVPELTPYPVVSTKPIGTWSAKGKKNTCRIQVHTYFEQQK